MYWHFIIFPPVGKHVPGMFLLAAGLPYVRFCVFFLADGVGWVGVGWGGLITFNGTSTHT